MKRGTRFFLYSLTILSVVLMNAIGPTPVYAEGGDDPPTEESAPPAEPTAESEPETSQSTPEYTVPQILEQVPEDTDLVVLNQEGTAEPLASQQAAEILVEGDPIWCPAGQVPVASGNGCTPSYPSFENLISELTTNAIYSGSGVIWVASSYAGADDNPIVFDGSSGNLSALTDLALLGGWSGVENSTALDPASPSLLDVPLTITNWTGSITVQNLDFHTASGTGGSLVVETDGDISLTNVAVDDNQLGPGASLDNCLPGGSACTASGDVTVQDSSFTLNDEEGLLIQTSGDVTVKDVTASDNNDAGVIVDTDYGNANDVKVKHVTVEDNGGSGVEITDADGNVFLAYITATGNGDGVQVSDIYGSVYATGLLTSSNTSDGLDIDNVNGVVVVQDSTASNNGDNGFEISFTGGELKLVCVTASENAGDGANLTSNGNVVVKCSTITDNADDGVDINQAPTAQLLSVTSTGNGDQDLEYDPLDTVLTIKKIDCSKKPPKPSSPSEPKDLYTKLYCLPGEITASLYATYGDEVEFKNLCGYEAGIFDQDSGAYPKAIPGGDAYISSLYEQVQLLLPNAPLADDGGIPGKYAAVIDDLAFLLPDGYTYAAAFFTVVLDEGEYFDPLPADTGLTIRFLIPETLDPDEQLTILWWDGGEWQDLGGEVSEDGLYFQVTTSEIGVFVLAIH